jgi:hypothetical protein
LSNRTVLKLPMVLRTFEATRVKFTIQKLIEDLLPKLAFVLPLLIKAGY